MVSCCRFISIVLYLWIVSYFCCLFSYHSLLELHYGGRMNKSQTAREQAIEVGLLVREAKQRLDAELFLDEYPRWELGADHWSIILHGIFLHATKWGKKEAERFIHQGCWDSLPRPDLEADQSAMKLMGYWTSHKVIWDLYHSVYLLIGSPGPPPCGPQQRREAIHDILSSLRNQLHWQVYPITAKEDTQGPVDEPWSRPRRRGDSHEEALWEARMACQRVVEAAQVVKNNIERLSQGMRDVQWTHPCSHSRSCLQSHSLDGWLRSPSRPWQEKRVTFWELEVKPDPEESRESYPPSRTLKPSCFGGPTNWICHVGGQKLQPSQGWKIHRNSPGRSGPPSWFQRSEAGSSWGKVILHPLPLSASPRVCSSQMNCHIRMCDSSLFS